MLTDKVVTEARTSKHCVHKGRSYLDRMVVGTLDYRKKQNQAADGKHQDAGLWLKAVFIQNHFQVVLYCK